MRETDGLPLVHPQLGTWPTTQACGLTGNWTCELSVCRTTPTPLSHTSQGDPSNLNVRNNFLGNMSIFSGVSLCPFFLIRFHLQLSCTFLICPKISISIPWLTCTELPTNILTDLNLDACIFMCNFVQWTILPSLLTYFYPSVVQVTETEAWGLGLATPFSLLPHVVLVAQISFPTFSLFLLPLLETMPLLTPSRTAALACSKSVPFYASLAS